MLKQSYMQIKGEIHIKEDNLLAELDKKTTEPEEVRMCFFLLIPPKIVQLHQNCVKHLLDS